MVIVRVWIILATWTSGRITFAHRRANYVGNRFISLTDFDVGWGVTRVAAQPELGLLPERRIGTGFGGCDRPAFAGTNLNRAIEPDGGGRVSGPAIFMAGIGN
jgi:hypothetical protein